MNEKDFDRILKADNSLRKAIRQREEKMPPMPADLNDRLMQRIKEEVPAQPAKTRRVIWPWIAAACVAAIMVVLLMPPRESHDGVMPSQPTVAQTEKKQTNKKSEVTITEEPKTIAAAETAPKAKVHDSPKTPKQVPATKVMPVTTPAETMPAETTEAEAKEVEVLRNHEQSKPRMLTESDIPITRPENYHYTPEEIALMKKQANEAYLKWVELELEIAKHHIEQTAQK